VSENKKCERCGRSDPDIVTQIRREYCYNLSDDSDDSTQVEADGLDEVLEHMNDNKRSMEECGGDYSKVVESVKDAGRAGKRVAVIRISIHDKYIEKQLSQLEESGLVEIICDDD
jgi:hypothetical protein